MYKLLYQSFSRLYIPFILFLVLLFPLSVLAVDENAMLSAMLGKGYASIATGYDQQLAEAPGVVTVITAKDIQKMGATTLEQVIATVPGIHITTARGIRSVYASRGITSGNNSDFLVKIDNIPIRDLVFGGRPIAFSMLVRNISRIEIVRGPGSVIHGSDAIGGIMNIITKTGKELINDPAKGGGWQSTMYGGSFDTIGGSLQYGGASSDYQYAFSFQAETTKGNDRTIKRDAQTVIDEQFNASASNAPGSINQEKTQSHLHLDVQYKEKLRLRLGHRSFNTESGVGASFALSPKDSFINHWFNVDADYLGEITPSITTETNIAYQISTQDVDSQHLPVGSPLIPNGMLETTNYFNHQLISQTKATINTFTDHRLQIGGGLIANFLTSIKHQQDFIIVDSPLSASPVPISTNRLVETKTLRPDPVLDRQRRFQYFGMIQDEWDIYQDWKLTTGLRIDKYSDQNNPVFSPRLALVYHFSPLLAGKLLYNRSFHAPSFLEQAFGNDLKPEIIDMVEISLEGKDLYMNTYSASWFWYKLNNLIVEKALLTAPAFENISLRGTGVELSSFHSFSDTVSAKFNYSFAWVIEEKTDKLYGLTPNHMLFGEINWEFFPSWNLNSQVKWISKRKRRQIDPRKPLNGYTNGSINLSKEFRYGEFSYLRLNFKIDNLFNVDAREPSTNALLLPGDIPLPGRRFMGIFEVTF